MNDNHCHKSTLAQLDSNIQVMPSPAATPVVKSLGYIRVISLAPWQPYMIVNKLEITPSTSYRNSAPSGRTVKTLRPRFFVPNAVADIRTNEL